jgi:hypothetical protein
MAVKNGWISGEKAAKVYTSVASTFGPNIEPEEKVVPVPDVKINKTVEKPPQTGVVK